MVLLGPGPRSVCVAPFVRVRPAPPCVFEQYVQYCIMIRVRLYQGRELVSPYNEVCQLLDAEAKIMSSHFAPFCFELAGTLLYQIEAIFFDFKNC